MISNPLFSVLIANYNNSKYITECVESIEKQTYKNWEIIIVDDCSTDKSVEIILKLIAIDSRIHLFQNDMNEGCGYTKKKCLEFAKGEICGFVDPDDKLTEDAIELMIKKHIESPETVLIGSRRIFCDEKMNIVDIAQTLEKKTKIFKSQLETPFLITHFATFKKSAYEKTEGLDAYMKRGVDQDLYLKLEETGTVDFIDKPLYYYRNHKNSISLNSNHYKATAWHVYAIISACKRRNLDYDDFCYLLNKKRNMQEKLINFFFFPLSALKRHFIQYNNILKYKNSIYFEKKEKIKNENNIIKNRKEI